MTNIIQILFMFIPGFTIQTFNLLPILWLIVMGLLIETHYVSRLTFFSNSIALISYFGLKNNLPPLAGLVIVLYFGLSFWSFLSYATNNKIRRIDEYEKFIEKNPWLLKIGSSLITGAIILLDMFHFFGTG